MEHSLSTGEQTVAQARKQTVAGDTEAALKTLHSLEGHPNVADAFKVWISLHECIARLAGGQLAQGNEIVARLVEKQAYKTGERGEEDQLQRFLIALNTSSNASGKPNPAMKGWSTDRFEPIGFLIAGLKEWNAARFESASALFQKFLDAKPKGRWVWIEDFKPLAQDYIEDYSAFQVVKMVIEIADTPEKKRAAAKQIPGLKAKLKRPGRLREELVSYERTLR